MAYHDAYLVSSLSKYQYADLAKRCILDVIGIYSDLRPNLDTFVFNDGRRKELLCLDGTIPVTYKGGTYNIPVCLWLIDTHPHHPPMVYVKPAANMQIKPGRHVDSNGKVYLPYLHEWRHPQSDLLGLLQILVIVFGEDMPVFDRGKAPPAQPPYPASASSTPYPNSMSQVKRDFGSFHASNVQELISANEEDYEPLPFPFDIPTVTDVEVEEFVFGKDAREKYFHLDDSCVFLNHGAFGACMRKVIEAVHKWQEYIERQPLRFFDREMLPQMVHITRKMAKFVGCPPTGVVLIPNVTTGMNAIMRSLPLGQGDIVYHLSLEYGAVKKILSVVCEAKGAKLHEQYVSLPIQSEEELVTLVEKSLPFGCKLAVFDHIPSNTPFVLPIQALAAVCQKRGIMVLVDGAHSLGQLELDIPSLGVDFYLTNCHKWFCGPKGTALMYIAPKHCDSVHPLVVSHGYMSGFHSQFIWTGLQDYSPFLALHTALSFWQNIGFQRVITQNKELADSAAKLLVELWNSHLLAPSSMTGSLLCVALPKDLYAKVKDLSYSHAEIVQNALYHSHHIEVPIKCVQGALYVRLSAHIYNSMEEYVLLAKAVITLTLSGLLH